MIWETINVVRDLPRLHEITTTLIRYGMADLVRKLGIATLLERAGRILHWKEQGDAMHLDTPVRVRRVLEDLGPTFVKLGQVMATRVDVFPPNWIAEFEKLQSGVPPVPFESLMPQLEAALGCSPHEIFQELQTESVAAASIAQVHHAKLQDGTPVVLKIRRPGIRTKIEADLRILMHLARLIEFEMPEMRRYQPIQIVMQFARSLRRELDFVAEARNIDRFAENFAGSDTVVIPRVYWEWTSDVMNVQQWVDGIPGNNLAAVEAAGLDRKVLAAHGADAVLKMIMVDGFYHADPHPGNVFYLPGNRIAMIDFGMVGRLMDGRRNQIVDLLAALAGKDDEGMLDVLLEWTGDAAVDESKLAADVNEFVFNYANVPLKDLRLGKLLGDLTVIMRDHFLVMPADLAMLFKALITLEGLGRQLDPDFDMVAHLDPFVRRVIAARYMPDALFKRGKRNLHDIFSILSTLPREVAHLIKEARRGKFKIDLDLKRLERFSHQLDSSVNRLTLGILTASLVIGSSIVMTVQGGPTLFGLPLFGLIGFMVAFFNSLWLILSIWHSGRD
ncbi:2-octaprenylphenol hydroxylase [Sulfuricella denitrificans skB26]|uniref:2-octaprenylphenol hydroxylase n=1 Tax=Sulfuricella denitrificans (strain DSM 22764 / NBRC 105220 / skB26) TaxID=1163617 RepID=S6AA86_SULDS|nr:AarF/UbiB family protein [Sulfuricella denitrificans]BAN35425.1 2-octaprenylphenol hydroxylase [Sulfuricella denitrificans skB26]